jgi:hypothetical protein
MAKQPRKEFDMELEEIKDKLSQQDKVLEQILWTIKGSVNLNLPGLLATVNKIAESMQILVQDVAELQSWKKRMQEGNINMNLPSLFFRVSAFLGWLIAVVLGILKFVV